MSEDSWVVGFHAVLGALRGHRAVEVVWVQSGRRDKRMAQIVNAARKKQVPLRQVPPSALEEVAGDIPHNGCVARTAPVGFLPLEQVLAPTGEPGRLLLLDTMDDPRNLGAIVRSAVAFGIDGIIIAGPGAPPLGGAAEKAAVGLLAEVPLVRVRVAGDTLRVLAEAGYWVFGAEAGGTDIREVSSVSRWVLCLGSEGKGLRAKTRTRIDEFVAIPMDPKVESLNISVAAGVLLYELCCRWS